MITYLKKPEDWKAHFLKETFILVCNDEFSFYFTASWYNTCIYFFVRCDDSVLYTLCSDESCLSRVALTSNIIHIFVVRTLEIPSCSQFEIYNKLVSTVVCVVYVSNFVPIDLYTPAPFMPLLWNIGGYPQLEMYFLRFHMCIRLCDTCFSVYSLYQLIVYLLGSFILSQIAGFHPSDNWIVFYCVYVPHFLYSLICW